MSNEKRPNYSVITRANDLVWLGIALAAFAPKQPAPFASLLAEAERHLKMAQLCLAEDLRRALEANANVFVEVKPGVWDVVWNNPPERVEEFRRKRRARSARGRKKE